MRRRRRRRRRRRWELHHRNDMATLEAEKRTLAWALGQDAKEGQERKEGARRRDELAQGGVPSGRNKREVLKEPPCPASPPASPSPRNSTGFLSLLACNTRLEAAMRRVFQAVDREDKRRGWVSSAVLVHAWASDEEVSWILEWERRSEKGRIGVGGTVKGSPEPSWTWECSRDGGEAEKEQEKENMGRTLGECEVGTRRCLEIYGTEGNLHK
ncbi:hypothetical protein NGA_0692400 [Nannochloropsis gaditana CCMP526]|uniref:uncharacterized protein n=1 Tax=Nannochloropsis gaditana (strain CCMP526) TaxID=1093141 RepID=UPI00029F68D8|nr:hypothetical protein NGA_0692400 [Nannochloropsis gaditana CCMP526]EKU23004.1 hypothetical protein NGA_0692400 [Nannochloropsis gaditana CCMP526]|eukprot:XP_005853355.1 hypothetical protein NGA_0692400 [Nannochloropsis gaditana CCMP526]